jgi:hypothetical protein
VRCAENTPQAIGPSQPFAELQNIDPNRLHAFPLGRVDRTAVVTSLELIGGGTPTSYARLALYEDDGGKPGSIVTWTGQVAVTAPGPSVGTPQDPTALVERGKSYWIAVVFHADGAPQLGFNTNNNAPAGYEAAFAFGQPPSQFPSDAVAIFNSEWNLFLRVRILTP